MSKIRHVFRFDFASVLKESMGKGNISVLDKCDTQDSKFIICLRSCELMVTLKKIIVI